MKLDTKFRAPCRGRWFGRLSFWLAGGTAILMLTSYARAGIVELDIVPASSSLGFVEKVLTGGFTVVITDIQTSYGEPNPSNVTNAWGKIYMDWTPGVGIQLLPSSRINYLNTFNYYPNRDNHGNIVAPPGGNPAPGQFGLELLVDFDGDPDFNYTGQIPGGPAPPTAGDYGLAKIFNLWHTFGTLDTNTESTTPDGGPPLTYAGGNNYQANPSGANAQSLLAMDGYQDIYGVVVDTIQLNEAAAGGTPFASPFVGNTITFDGVTLTIPMTFEYDFQSGADYYHIETFGNVVATVTTVPEPSSGLLWGTCVLGLAGYACRFRRRRLRDARHSIA